MADEIKQQEGPRMTKLRVLLEKALSKTLKNCSYDKVAQCFSQLAQDSPEALQSAVDQVVDFLKTRINEEFETIVEKRDLINKLNSLDELIASAKKMNQKEAVSLQRPAPEIAILSKTVVSKREEMERLKAQLLEVQQENSGLMEDLKAKNKAMESNKKEVMGMLQEIDQAMSLASNVQPQTLSNMVDDLMVETNPNLVV
ncbi:hypothetical protein K493DRAFT_404935 [Basidiobolus meristosporus CBS 931.73]|uniref:Nnf1-domain-containing protein n=1 Tax=Basidiobolus meristosporus CBS 931.73 TaxID=1314790 RepID=A0A1Y1Z0A9_9FUNG|nr:hypothetical protein K493DRAFT_404935 [Basidiobolus meristosporus CBS 931.73]|eukprot:ORY03626.1 hypothetical protein K493DRAFT_404935 [Basidiobolus meristosporus CBS 931.73]